MFLKKKSGYESYQKDKNFIVPDKGIGSKERKLLNKELKRLRQPIFDKKKHPRSIKTGRFIKKKKEMPNRKRKRRNTGWKAGHHRKSGKKYIFHPKFVKRLKTKKFKCKKAGRIWRSSHRVKGYCCGKRKRSRAIRYRRRMHRKYIRARK